tara:strand:+ start:11802 stop:12113 length:312 start_codon:yes stop_codon:yes gene_type:complete
MKRVYIFKRTFTEVRTFAVPANSWEDAKLQIEDENYAETVRLNQNIRSGYSSNFKRLHTMPISYCESCFKPMIHYLYNEPESVQMVFGAVGATECFTCRLRGV